MDKMLPHEEKYLREFTNAYIEAALWTYNDFPEDRLDKDTLKKMKEDCAKFVKENEDTIDNGWDGCTSSLHNNNPGYSFPGAVISGHDFWLTRNGHGAGFWDGDWPEPEAAMLTKASEAFGEFDICEATKWMYNHS